MNRHVRNSPLLPGSALRSRSGRRSVACGRVLLCLVVAAFMMMPYDSARAQEETDILPAGELGWIERLYREGAAYRAESEMLRFLHYHPDHRNRDAVELARAKLYYRDGRYAEANRALFSLLDRFPRGEAAPAALRLLTYSNVRQGHYAEAVRTLPVLRHDGTAQPSLDDFARPPPGAADPDGAVAWSTWLPGSGYFAVDQPGKATAALTLTLTLTAAAVISAKNDNAGAGLVFLLLELMLYQGGREGVRQEAEAFNRRLREEQTDAWLARHGERELLRIGIEVRFGGR